MFIHLAEAMEQTPWLIACLHCDALHRVPPLRPGQQARCRCCGARLVRHPKGGLDRPLATMFAALVLFVLANAYPLVSLRLAGFTEATTLVGTSLALWRHQMPVVSLLVFLVSIAVPLAIMLFTTYVLAALRFGVRLPGVRALLVFLSRLHPWEMGDVFLVSVLVALVKLAGVAEVIVGPGLLALAGAVVLAVAARADLEPALLWRAYDALGRS